MKPSFIESGEGTLSAEIAMSLRAATEQAIARGEVHICRYAHIGDVVASTIVATAIKSRAPGTKIFFYAREGPWCEILRHHPDIDTVHAVSDDMRIDIDLRQPHKRFGIPNDAPMLEMIMALAGLDGYIPRPRLGITSDERESARALLGNHPRPWIAVGLRSRVPRRTIEDASWCAAARHFAGRGSLFGLGGPGESPAPEGMIDLVGQLNIREAAAIIAECDLFVGVDSGLMHIASAVNAPMVLASQATDPRRFIHPLCNAVVVKSSAECEPCYEPCRICRERPPCMAVSPEAIAAAIEGMLEGTQCGGYF